MCHYEAEITITMNPIFIPSVLYIIFKQFVTKWTNIWDQPTVLTALLSSSTTEILKTITAIYGCHSMDHTNKFFYWLYDHFFGTSWLC
jgi:hypothetical protein